MTTPARSAAFFDLDKTIIATSSATAFSRPFFASGMITRQDAIRTAYAQFLFQIGGADESQTNRLRDALSELIKGWEVAKVREIVEETIHELIDPVVYQEALELIRRHQLNGRDVIIVSASGAEVVEPIAKMLGADHAIASQMAVEDGKYTGEISFYAYGQAKADAITELAKVRGYDLALSYAYSDSITDAPLLDAVGAGFAINPDRAMRRAAQEHGWGVLRFRKPIGIKESRARKPAIAAGALAVVAVGGVLAWRAMRRRSVRVDGA